MHAVCTVAEAPTSLRDAGSVPWFRQRFAPTEHSWLPKPCAAALAELGPDFPATFAVECLAPRARRHRDRAGQSPVAGSGAGLGRRGGCRPPRVTPPGQGRSVEPGWPGGATSR